MIRPSSLILATLCATAVLASVAQAGTYDVIACDPAVAGGANNSFDAVADPGMTAYTRCPADEGLVTRNAWDNGTTGFLQGAWFIFDAPATTQVASISFDAGWKRHDCSYTIGVISSSGDLNGNQIFGEGAGSRCDAGTIPVDTDFYPVHFNYDVNAPRVRIETRCGAFGGCSRNGVSSMRLRNVAVHVRDDVAPNVGNLGGNLASGQWLAGTQRITADANDPAGVRASAVSVDGKGLKDRTYDCDITRRAPCPGAVTVDESFATSSLGGDGPHTLTVSATDLAGNTSTTDRTVLVDNTPPGAPVDLSVEGGDGWRPTKSFSVGWTLPKPDGTSPVNGARWRLCKAGTETCTEGGKDEKDLTSLKGIEVPEPGEYTLKVWLRDEAGNGDPRLSGQPVTLRYDDASPQAQFEPLDAADPTRLAVATTDRGSGLGGGQIQIRRKGTDAWSAIPTAVDGDRLVARLDDEHLADGRYELAATATDKAGNAKATSVWADGTAAEVTLPLRLKTYLRTGIVRRSGRKTRLAHAAYVSYGQRVRVSGRLTSKGGNPLQDVEVQAVTQVRDGHTPPRLLATVKTSKTGRFSFIVRRGPSRSISVRYVGAPQIRSVSSELSMNVRASTSIKPDRRRLVNGEIVKFRGKVSTGRLPDKGKLVEVQVWVRGKWRTFATTRASRRGVWSYDYRFDGTRGNQEYRFRAQLPAESGYPFASGLSRIVRVHVRGM